MKKVILLILTLGVVINPVTATAQIGNVDDSTVEEFSEDVSKSWGEAKTIWRQIYNTAKPFWDRHIGWRIDPMWDAIKRWVNVQISILKDAFKDDAEKAGEVIKEEAGQAGESVSKSVWQMIMDSVGGKEKD